MNKLEESSSAFLPYRSPNRQTPATPPVPAIIPVSPIPSPPAPSAGYGIDTNINKGMGSPGGIGGGTETDSLFGDNTTVGSAAGMAGGGGGGSAAAGAASSDQRFKRLSKQLQRSYQEKHLLLTEIQVMKDQLRQWNRDRDKDKNKIDSAASGPTIGPLGGGEEDAAWFALIDLNERTNALVLYYLCKGIIFKAKLFAFRKWKDHNTSNATGEGGNSDNYNQFSKKNSTGGDGALSTFEQRRLELLEMAAAVTTATSFMSVRNNSNNNSSHIGMERRHSRSMSPTRTTRSAANHNNNNGDGVSGGGDSYPKALFPEEDDSTTATNTHSDATEYFYYDATGRHSSREGHSSRREGSNSRNINNGATGDQTGQGGARKGSNNTDDKTSIKQNIHIPRLAFGSKASSGGAAAASVVPGNRKRYSGNNNGNGSGKSTSTLTAPTLTSHLRQQRHHQQSQHRQHVTPSASAASTSARGCQPRGYNQQQQYNNSSRNTPVSGSMSYPPNARHNSSSGSGSNTRHREEGEDRDRAYYEEYEQQPHSQQQPRAQPHNRPRSVSETRVSSKGVHMTHAAEARAAYNNSRHTTPTNTLSHSGGGNSGTRGRSADGKRGGADVRNSNRRASSDGMVAMRNHATPAVGGGGGSAGSSRMRASFPMSADSNISSSRGGNHQRSQSPQHRNNTSSGSGGSVNNKNSNNKSHNSTMAFLNNSGGSLLPLPALHREPHHVVLPSSPPDSDCDSSSDSADGDRGNSGVSNNRAGHFMNNYKQSSSPPPLPVNSDGVKLKQQREQQLEQKSIAQIIASFGMQDKVGGSSGVGVLNSSVPMPAGPISSNGGGSTSSKPASSAPNSALQRWGISMQPMDPVSTAGGKPALVNSMSTATAGASLPDLPTAHTTEGGNIPFPSTPGGAKRRAEVAMSIIHSMAAVGDSIAGRSMNSSNNNSYSNNYSIEHSSRTAFR